MGVDQDRQFTARDRRGAIIKALNAGFNLSDPNSHLSAFVNLVKQREPRLLFTNADIDGVVSTQMLSAVTGWPVVALVDRFGTVRVHPNYGTPQDLVDTGRVFGVDVFSPLFPGVSNHPIMFGATTRTSKVIRDDLVAFDAQMSAAVATHHIINLSAWVGIAALAGSNRPNGMPYKYPLGTAQLLLAVLEAAGLKPRLYDRQYLPWLIANCDGGIDTIRSYAWNAETWWSAMAAAVGPSSHSEALYRLATTQRPNEFLDVDRRLRYDEPVRSQALNTRWNLVSANADVLQTAVGLIRDLSGWEDPFLDGASGTSGWKTSTPTRNVLPATGLTKVDTAKLAAHLASARTALHMNFSVFRERGTALGWMLADTDEAVEGLLGVDTAEEVVPDDDPTIPDQATDGAG